ncbi:MAG: hypothetical protein IJ484_00580 [Oscillospiraceae bacterium]|nr:hypothetical protein [Oscillospiraceae bacterium]
MTVKLLIRLLPVLLAAGFAAAALPVLAGAEKGKRGAALRRIWTEERWLWLDSPDRPRETLGMALVAAYFVLEWLWDTAVTAAHRLMGLAEIPAAWSALGTTLVCAVVLAKIVFGSRMSGRQLFTTEVLCAMFLLWHIITGYDPIARSLYAMLLLKDVDLRKVLNWLWGCIAAKLGLHLVLIAAGVLSLGVSEQWAPGRIRSDLEFGSVNFLGIALVTMAMAWLALRPAFKLWYVLPYGAVLAFVLVVPNCRSAVVVGAGYLVLRMAAQYLPDLFTRKWLQGLMCLASPLIAVVTWMLSWRYDPDSAWMISLDRLLSGRLELAYVTLQLEPYTFQEHHWYGRAFAPSGIYRVDNSYIYYFLLCGPIMLLLICAGFALLIHKLQKQGDQSLALLVLMLTAYAVMERCLNPSLNMALYLMPCVLYWGTGHPLTLQTSAPTLEKRPYTHCKTRK